MSANVTLKIIVAIVCLNIACNIGESSTKLINGNNSASTLRSVHVYIRHGHRAPLCEFKGGITGPEKWPNGLRQLTRLGQIQSALMGRYLRDRYRRFYPRDSRLALVQAVSTDRRLDSGAIIINQLWPPSDAKTWIAPRMYSLPNLQDMAFGPLTFCPNYDIEIAKFLLSDEVIKFIIAKQEIIGLMVSELGINGSVPNQIYAAADALYVTKMHNLPVPDWVIPYWDDIEQITNVHLTWVTGTPLLLRLRAGPLFRDLGLRLDQVLSGNKTIDGRRRNFYLYPAHTYILSKIMHSLNIPRFFEPPFGSMIIFELHTINNRNVVRTFYINETEDISKPIRGHQVILDACGDYDCPFDLFRELVAKLSVNDIKTECGIPDEYIDNIYNLLQENVGYPTESFTGPDGLPVNAFLFFCPFENERGQM